MENCTFLYHSSKFLFAFFVCFSVLVNISFTSFLSYSVLPSLTFHLLFLTSLNLSTLTYCPFPSILMSLPPSLSVSHTDSLAHFVSQLHEDTIHDLFFLDGSWPWGSGKAVLVSGSATGEVKVNGLDRRPLYSFSTHPPVTLLHPSPDGFNASLSSGYPSECVCVCVRYCNSYDTCLLQ